MSDTRSGTDIANTTMTFSDAAAAQNGDSTTITTGVYRPSNYDATNDVFAAGAPAGPYADPGPGGTPTGTATLNGTFGGVSPNGTWQLFVSDDASADGGTISGGCLEFAAPTARVFAVPL